jgi:hypothetical protein
MVVSPDPFLDTCFIKKPIKPQAANESQISESLDDFINNSAKDLAQTIKTNSNLEKHIDTPLDKYESSKTENIDLNISFDEPDKIDNTTNKTNLVELGELEEADILVDLDVEEIKPEITEDPNILKEVDFSSLENNLETITLKKPNQVYHEIYEKAREKAKEAKKTAILAYLEMKNIKKTYMLDDIDDSDSEFEDFAADSEDSDTESLEDNFK